MADGSKQLKLAAGIVIVHARADGQEYLLLRAYRYWDFPKGLVEPGEAPVQAAQREALEETGLTNLEFRWGKRCIETAPYRNKIARYYLAQSRTTAVTLGVSPVLGKPEHHEYRWCDYETGRSLLVPRVLAVLDWAHDQIERG